MRKPQTSPTSPPSAGEDRRGESGHLGYLLRQANVAFRARLERALADLHVTQPQFVVLTMIGAYPGLSNADLARASLLTPQTLSVIVANLRKAGLVAAQPHPIHGRIVQLGLTPSGERTLAGCRERVATLETRLTQDLSRDEERAIRGWLVRIAVEGASGSGAVR